MLLHELGRALAVVGARRRHRMRPQPEPERADRERADQEQERRLDALRVRVGRRRRARASSGTQTPSASRPGRSGRTVAGSPGATNWRRVAEERDEQDQVRRRLLEVEALREMRDRGGRRRPRPRATRRGACGARGRARARSSRGRARARACARRPGRRAAGRRARGRRGRPSPASAPRRSRRAPANGGEPGEQDGRRWAAHARTVAPGRGRTAACAQSREEDAAQLVLLARLEDREHLVAGLRAGSARPGSRPCRRGRPRSAARPRAAAARRRACPRSSRPRRPSPRRSRGSPCAARAGGSGRARAPRARSAP